MQTKKPRHVELGCHLDADTTFTGMRRNDDGSFTFFGTAGEEVPVKGTTGRWYARGDGQKAIYRIPDQGRSIGSLETVLSRFTKIIAVDTNTRTDEGELVSVAVIGELRNLKFENGGDRCKCQVIPLWGFEFRGATKPAEKIGWLHALAKSKQLGWFENGASLLLIVDAYLSEHDELNRRTLPVFDNEFLPECVSLAYATADAATDSPMNALMARCDAVARTVMKHVTSPSAQKPELGVATHSPFRAWRDWEFNIKIAQARSKTPQRGPK